MRRINRAWLDGQVEDLAPMVHPEIVMSWVCRADTGAGGVSCRVPRFLSERENL